MRFFKSIDKYLEWIRMGIKSQLAYRGTILDRLLGFSVRFIVLYFFWQAVYMNQGTINGRSLSEMITYISLSLCISSLYISPTIYFISEDIKSGNIIYILLKPVDYQLQFFSKQIGIFLYMIVFVFSIFFVFYSIVNTVPIPANPIYFIISLFLGLLTVVSFDFLLGLFCFWTENSWGLTYFQYAIVELISGTLITLDFFPAGIREVVIQYLPFQGIVYTPIRLFQETWTGQQFWRYFFFQSCWILLFIMISRLIFHKARSSVLINGG